MKKRAHTFGYARLVRRRRRAFDLGALFSITFLDCSLRKSRSLEVEQSKSPKFEDPTSYKSSGTGSFS